MTNQFFFLAGMVCGDSDDASYEAIAVNPLGEKVHLIVCAGWPFKGVTVRSK